MTSPSYLPLTEDGRGHPGTFRSASKSRWLRPVLAAGGLLALVYLIFGSSSDATQAITQKFRPSSSMSAPTAVPPKRKLLLQVGGVPGEGFGSTLGFIRGGIRLAALFDADFYPVKTFHWGGYSVMEELTVGRSLNDYDFSNTCNLYTQMGDSPLSGTFQDRVDQLRKAFKTLLWQTALWSMGKPHDEVLLNDVRSRLSECTVIVLADQDIHQDGVTDVHVRKWLRQAIGRGVEEKYKTGAATRVPAADVNLHYRWGDMWDRVKSTPKWAMDNAAMEKTLGSIEECLGRKLKVNVFMKPSPEKKESDEQLRAIIHPLRQEAPIFHGEDDIADLWHLSQTKILAVAGGAYSNIAATLGQPKIVITNGWHPGDYSFVVEQDHALLLKQGDLLDDKQCEYARANL